jgi:hypothetical protein
MASWWHSAYMQRIVQVPRAKAVCTEVLRVHIRVNISVV